MQYRSVPTFTRISLGDATEVIYDPISRSTHTLPTSETLILQGCIEFAPLEEHSARLSRELNLPSENVHQALERLVSNELLVSHQSLVDRCRRTSQQKPPAQIASIGVPTRNRPKNLEQCLRSYAECAKTFGRDLRFVIVDGSDSEEYRHANQHVLETLKKELGTRFFYIATEEKREFANYLIERGGLPPTVVNYALLNPERCPIDIGCSRNILLLSAVGELSIQVDDDTVCALGKPPGTQPGLSLTSRFDPTEFWFPKEEHEAWQGIESACEDFYALHETLLGRSIGDCLDQNGQTTISFDQTSSNFFRKMEFGDSAVSVTSLGVAGKSGMGSPKYLLTLQSDSRSRLLDWEDVYRRTLTTSQLIRAAKQTTISDFTFCMGINLGLDNRKLLPPFMPVQRNEDGVFGSLYGTCVPGSFFGLLPRTVRHQPLGPAQYIDFMKHKPQVESGVVFDSLVRMLKPFDTLDASKNLNALGATLIDWAAAPINDFEEIVSQAMWKSASETQMQMEQRLQEHDGTPDFWAADMQTCMDSLRQAIADNTYSVPHDLVRAFGEEQARKALPYLVGRFGQLLQIWPEMHCVAKEWRAEGQLLGRQI